MLLEIISGLLALAFGGWAYVVWNVGQSLDTKLDIYMVSTEHRVTKLETSQKQILKEIEQILHIVERRRAQEDAVKEERRGRKENSMYINIRERDRLSE